MDSERDQLLAIFAPAYQEKYSRLKADEFKFVQYTSAQAVVNIIQSKQIWIRYSQCMNDYSEIMHGYNCLVHAYRSEPEGKRFKEVLNRLYPGLPDELGKLFDSWIPHFRDGAYIACFSEHPAEGQVWPLVDVACVRW